jgi:hypothetical protein
MNTKTKWSIFAAVIALAIVIQISFIIPAHALTYYFNCISRIANKNGTITLENAVNCYDKVFKGAKQVQAQVQNNNTTTLSS